MTALTVVLLALAGGVGAGSRYVLDRMITVSGGFPVGILVVNVTGSFALGLVTGMGAFLSPEVVLVLGVGLLGGYTTFSTVSVETALMAERRERVRAWANLLGTLALAVAAAAAGIVVGMWSAGTLST